MYKKTNQPVLTKAQTRVLIVLADLIDQFHRPSLLEWAQSAGADGGSISQAAIMQHRNVLMAKGMIENTPGKTRSTRVTPLGYETIGRTGKATP